MEFLEQDPTVLDSYKHHQSGTVHSVAYATTAKGEQVLSGGSDCAVSVFDKNKAAAFRLVGHQSAVNWVTGSRSGSHVVSGGMDKTVRVWENSQRGNCIVHSHHQGPVRCVDVSSDDSLVLSCSDDKTIKIAPLLSPSGNIATIKAGNNWIRSCAFSKDSRLILSGGDDKLANVWDLETQKRVVSLAQNTVVRQVAWSHDSSCLALALPGLLKILDLRSRQLLQQYEVDGLSCLDYHPASHYIVAGTPEMVKIFDLRMAKLIYSLQGHSSPVTSVAFNQTGSTFLSAAQDKIIEWNFGGQPATIKRVEPVQPVSSSPLDPVHLELTLDKMITQLDIVNSTLSVFEQRIGNSENQISSINLMIKDKLRGVDNLQEQLADLSSLSRSQVQFSKAPNYQ